MNIEWKNCSVEEIIINNLNVYLCVYFLLYLSQDFFLLLHLKLLPGSFITANNSGATGSANILKNVNNIV